MTERALRPCMGGWCNAREGCAHYHVPSGSAPSERLCDGVFLARVHPVPAMAVAYTPAVAAPDSG